MQFASADTEGSEIYSASRHALGFYKCVANTCRYSISQARLEGRTIRQVWETAVAHVVLAIPFLSVGIADQDTNAPRFVQRPFINLDDHFDYLDADPDTQDSTLLGILEDQHDRSWPDIESRPPWKLTTVVRNAVPEDDTVVFDVVFAVHHSIADGRSTAMFHAALLEELNRRADVPAELSGRILNIPGPRRLVAPQEEQVKSNRSWSFLARTLWRELGPAWLQGQQPPAPWTGKIVAPEPCRTRLRLLAIPAVAMPGILAACRVNQTTLTPLLHALALASFARHVPLDELKALQSSTPIDLRRFVSDSSQISGSRRLFGVFVTSQSHVFDSGTITALREGSLEDGIWRLAADLRRSMKQHLDNMPNDDITSMLSYVTDWQKFWLSKVGKPRQNTWEVSNIGSMPGGHEERNATADNWKITRSTMSQGATVTGAAVSISVAGVIGGEIGIALGWQEGIVEAEMVDGLAGDLEAWLCRLGRGEALASR